MCSFPQPWRMVVCAALLGIFAAGAAQAADTGNGSKNFSTPRTVPNYFSNEAGPILGPASETQRGPLYMTQTYGTPRAAAVAAPQPAAPRYYRQHVAMAEPRGRLIRGRSARVVAHHIIVHGRVAMRAVAHGSARGHTAHAVVRAMHSVGRSHPVGASHAISRATRASTSHRHGRG